MAFFLSLLSSQLSDRPKSLKLLVVAFPLGAQDYGNGTMTGPPVSG